MRERSVWNRLLCAGVKVMHEKQRRARLKFAKDNKNWTVENESRVIFFTRLLVSFCFYYFLKLWGLGFQVGHASCQQGLLQLDRQSRQLPRAQSCKRAPWELLIIYNVNCVSTYAENCNNTVIKVFLMRPHPQPCCQLARRFVIAERQRTNHEAHLCFRQSEKKQMTRGGVKTMRQC